MFSSETSLINSPVISRCVAISFPLILLSCIVAYAISNAHVGTAIEGSIRVGNYRTPSYRVFEFSMWQTIKDMWDAKTYYLSLLIAVWSGIWPYLKALLLLLTWILPPKYLSVGKRRLIITIISILAKWALCDIYLLVFFDVAFRFHVLISSAPYLKKFLPLEFISADLVVKPLLPSFVFISATIIVIICVNWIDYYDRNDIAFHESCCTENTLDTDMLSLKKKGWFKGIFCPRRSWFER